MIQFLVDMTLDAEVQTSRPQVLLDLHPPKGRGSWRTFTDTAHLLLPVAVPTGRQSMHKRNCIFVFCGKKIREYSIITCRSVLR